MDRIPVDLNTTLFSIQSSYSPSLTMHNKRSVVGDVESRQVNQTSRMLVSARASETTQG